MEGLGTGWHDHVFLEFDSAVSVLAAIDDVHHWDRKFLGVWSTDVTVEWDTEVVSGGLCTSKGHTKDGVGTKVLLGFGAIEFDHGSVDEDLFHDVGTDKFWGDDVVDVLNSLEDALATEVALIAIAKL